MNGYPERLPTLFQRLALCLLALKRERSQGDQRAQLLRLVKARLNKGVVI